MEFSTNAIGQYFKNRSWISTIKHATNWKKGRTVKVRVSPMLEQWYAEALLDEDFKQVANEIGHNGSSDNKAIRCLRWVRNNFTYVGDPKTWGVGEYWQSPRESLTLLTGDCEDGAILMYVLCRLVGVPKEQLKLFAGDVQGGGHCWLGYVPAKAPWTFKFLDWCYWYNDKTMNYRPDFFILGRDIFGEDPRYMKMWFAFDEEDSYYLLNNSL